MNKGRIGSGVGLLALICVILALAINNISGYAYDIDAAVMTMHHSMKCRWQTFDWCGNFICLENVKYSAWCEDNDNQSDSNDSDWCRQEKSGQVWVTTLVITVLLAAIAVLSSIVSHFQRVQGYIKWLYLTCCVLTITAFSVWIGVGSSTDICYHTGSNNGRYWGASLVFEVIAIVLFIIAFAFTFTTNDGEYEPLL
eukprot:CAMPEP_0197028942 /NCGR_PEP_ID=MMETSP1384-20130603/8512_1 /TAXON_ID=29189 /ORGANISM="Ammonia sp." /LENGTH=196 /DNA_ID=CAMNT_0042458023 /DNA_START=12 /DNA_END=602 /DNA_ORIENTATION=+